MGEKVGKTGGFRGKNGGNRGKKRKTISENQEEITSV
jgi:hypothetical protein